MLNKTINNNMVKILPKLTLLLMVMFFAGYARTGAVAAEYTQSYQSDKPISFGSLVSLVAGSEQKIELATNTNARNFLGVNVSDGGSTLAVNKQENQTQVAVNGKVVALVSDIFGPIHKGDLLTISTIDGIAAKAMSDENVIGSAGADFSTTSQKNTTQNITSGNGQNQQVNIGPLEIELFRIQKNTSGRPGFIGWVERVSGEPVAPFKMASVTVIAFGVIASITAMSYSAIRTTITQSSRNPLARPVIMQVLARIFVGVILIAIFGSLLIYLVLKV